MYLFLVWLHIVAAVVWIGGMLFMTFVLMPVVRDPAHGATAAALVGSIGRRFRTLTWALLLVLVVTGFINASFRGVTLSSYGDGEFWSSGFGTLLAAKLVVFSVMLVLSLVHDFVIGPRAKTVAAAGGDPEQVEAYRWQATILGRINLVLGLVIIAIAVVLIRP